MRYIYLLFALLIFASCEKDKKGDLGIQFTGVYDNEVLVMATPLDYRQDYPLRIDKSTFFVTNLSIVNEEGEEFELSEVELVDLTAFDLNTASAGKQFTYENIPEGKYTRIQFTIGVSSGLNAMQPEDFPSTNPLNESVIIGLTGIVIFLASWKARLIR